MTTTPLRSRPTDEQARVLVAAARSVLPAFGLDGADVELVANDFNATCRLDHPEGRFAMRLNIASERSVDEVAAELAWTRALAADGVAVARPRAGRAEEVPTVRVPGVDRDVPVVVFAWLDGADLGDALDEDRDAALQWVRGLGAAMGRLHEHARGWELPPDAARPAFDSVLLDLEDRLADADGPWRTPRVTAALDATREAVLDHTAELLADDATRLLVHADLHMWNAKLTDGGGTPVVFDFDDAGFAHPALDLAISTFYFRDDPVTESALHEGLAASGPLGSTLVDAVGTPAFEALVAGRQWLLLDDVVCNPVGPPPGFDVPAYAGRAATRLEQWLETGRFSLVT